MRKKPAETSNKEAAAYGVPSDEGEALNILVAGIPTPALLEMIQARHPGQLNLYVAECRPYEMQVARALAAFPSRGIRVTVVTDNMISALIETFPIRAVWSQYLEIEEEHAVAINGAHLAALLARPCGIPCFLYPISNLPTGQTGRFAGEDITVPGSGYIPWEPDIVPLELVTEVVGHGSVNF